MRKFTLLNLMCICFAGTLSAQLKQLDKTFQNLQQKLPLRNSKTLVKATTSVTGVVSCTRDTVYYTDQKTNGGTVISLVGNGQGKIGEGLAQWYDVRQPITIYGLQFYGRAKNAGSTAVVNVKIYSSKSDSTPNAPLDSAILLLNNTALSFAAMFRTVNFATPVTVTGPYLVVVEAPTNGTDTLQLLTNAAGDGTGERLSKVRIQGTQWFDVGNAYGLDVDFITDPMVSYSISARYKVSGSLTPGGNVIFTNASSPVINDWFYNQAAYFGATKLSYYWNLGEGGPGFGSAVDTSHLYATAGNYTVTLRDTLFGWTMDCITDTTSVVRISTSLPIKLTTYEAAKKDNRVAITWSTENEFNNDYFEIERSGDGVNFKPITKVKSFGVSSVRQNYVAYDDSPQPFNYYRLIQYDKDGHKTYYGIRIVSLKDNLMSLQVYPNPASSSFTIRTQAGLKNAAITITNVEGKIVKNITAEASGLQTISTAGLANGNYFVHVTANGSTITEKLVIKKN
jgi:hypothetical protein